MKLIITMMMVVIMSTTTTMRYMLVMKMVLVATNLTASLLQRALLVLVVELLHNHVDPRARSQLLRQSDDDMEFVKNFAPPDFQAKNFTLSISPNFKSFSKKKHKK